MALVPGGLFSDGQGQHVDSFEVSRAQRDVLLGATPDAVLSQRVQKRLPVVRDMERDAVDENGLVLKRGTDDARLWT